MLDHRNSIIFLSQIQSFMTTGNNKESSKKLYIYNIIKNHYLSITGNDQMIKNNDKKALSFHIETMLYV